MKKLFRLLLLVGIIIAIVKAVSAKKEWSGLSEAEARAKIDGKLGRRIEDLEKRAEIADKVIEQMKNRGMLAAAPVQPVGDEAQAAEEPAGGAEPADSDAEDAADDSAGAETGDSETGDSGEDAPEAAEEAPEESSEEESG